MDQFIALCGEEIQDLDEALFLTFSTPIPSSNLGFLSSTTSTLSITISPTDSSSTDYTIHQSPGLLASNAASGTTGAVLWKITPLVAEWLSSPENALFKHGILGPSSHVVELGCGISGLLALSLSAGGKVGRVVVTDLGYVLKGVRGNLVENGLSVQGGGSGSTKGVKGKKGSGGGGGGGAGGEGDQEGVYQRVSKPGKKAAGAKVGEVQTLELDWTTCTREYVRANLSAPEAVDCILACDCIYNEALVEPFVQTCVDLCSLRESPPLCLVAQQLRSDLVFDAWLRAFSTRFRVYRVPDDMLSPELRDGSGYVVHVGTLKQNERE